MTPDSRIAAARQLLAQRRHAKRGKPERSFLSIHEVAPEEFMALLRGGLDAKANPERYRRALADRPVALLFQKTSTRTRCSFEVGVGDMGGQPVYIDWRTSNFTLGELSDEIRVLSRYFDLIMARVYKHEDLLTMREHSEVPVINGLDDRYHPCQGLTDYMTVLEYFGELAGLKLAYIGDGNNVCHSLIDGGAATGVHVAVAHPPGYAPREDVVERARTKGAEVTITQDPREAVADADVVYTDTWVSMGDEAQTEARLKAFAGFQVDAGLLAAAPDHVLVMHCLPAHRGFEISGEALDSANSVVFDQAENRKHAQKYLMAWILEAV
ncbi:MAG TPA: ornithine carbamoyltransferase [Thermoanaerobaculia bacterium]|nr:ornithine carbamoyltransferase [Thermoanaerobaculia bacterium]